MMPKLSLALTLAGVLALGSQLEWKDALLLNAARLAHTRAAFASEGDGEHLAQQARMATEQLASRANDSRVQALVGSLRRADGDLGSATASLSQAVALDPHDVTSRELLADALFRAGDADAAVAQWRAAGAGKMAQRRGDAAMTAGDLAAAIAYFRVLTRLDTTAVDGWLKLGETYTAVGLYDAARDSYEELIRRWPQRAVGYARLANLYYFRMGRPDLASQILDAAIANAPGAEFYMVRSQIAAEQRRYAEAESDARQALALEPANGTYLLWLGDLFQSQKRYDEAVAQYTLAAEQSTNRSLEWLAPLRTGRALTAAGRLDDAVGAYEAAVAASVAQRVPPRTLAAHYVLLGEACLRIDRIARARWAFTEALAHDASNESAARHLKALSGR